jgi:hypothetical protein
MISTKSVQINPSEDLEYHQCYGEWQCARLLVPLDWQKPNDETLQVALAVMKIPAKVHVTDPRYGGAVIINPGLILNPYHLQ